MAMETGARPTVGGDRRGDHRVPLPAGYQQMEQNRAPALLQDHPELARPTAGNLPDRRQPHRQHHHDDRTDRSMPTRPEPLSYKDQSNRSREEVDTPRQA